MVYLTVAYSVIWLGTLIYLFGLNVSLIRAKKDLISLKDKFEKEQ